MVAGDRVMVAGDRVMDLSTVGAPVLLDGVVALAGTIA